MCQNLKLEYSIHSFFVSYIHHGTLLKCIKNTHMLCINYCKSRLIVVNMSKNAILSVKIVQLFLFWSTPHSCPSKIVHTWNVHKNIPFSWYMKPAGAGMRSWPKKEKLHYLYTKNGIFAHIIYNKTGFTVIYVQ